MSVPVRWLVQRRDLGLRVLAGQGDLDRPVTWAHSIELADPTPWLSGGELVLTTGLRLPPEDADGAAAYVRRLAAAGVAALGLGVGLSHPRVPPALVENARATGLALLEVPLPTPFVAITKALMERLAELQYEGVVRASRSQPRMTRAALRGGARAVVRELASAAEAGVLLLTDDGQLLAAHPAEAADLAPGLLADTGERGPAGMLRTRAASAVSASPHRTVTVQQVRLGLRPHGRLVLVTDHSPTPVDHLLLGHAASLLALEAEKPLRLRDEQHRVHGLVLGLLLDGALTPAAAREHLTEAGFPSQAGVRVLALRGSTPRRVLDAAAEDLAARGLPLFGAVREGCAVVLLPGDDPGAARALAGGAAARLRPRPWAGLSAVHAPADAGGALREALNAAALGPARREELVDYESLAGQVLIADPDTRAVLAGLAQTRLGPLAAHDRTHGSELLLSLRTFLEHHGHWESAATALGIHRHTLRGRLDKARTLLAVDLDSAHVRAELLLALTAWPGV
ncbi:PucR family transcriptional regulator [Kitasatospora sp. NPDC056181]|uniref:PucR family transcriptional regulator n=1 Tax=Kitasatospora sp. NPDC056181 TaxID=3345737 RepID=UPI0035DBBE90